jgi:hypothetical protein
LIGSTSPIRSAIVGGGQLLAVAPVARQPGDLHRVAVLRHAVAALLADRVVGIVVDLAVGDHRRRLVEQVDQAARDARLGLAALAEQDDVLARQDRVLDLRQDRLVVADDAREDALAAAEFLQEVGAHLVLHGARAVALLFEFAECLG